LLMVGMRGKCGAGWRDRIKKAGGGEKDDCLWPG